MHISKKNFTVNSSWAVFWLTGALTVNRLRPAVMMLNHESVRGSLLRLHWLEQPYATH